MVADPGPAALHSQAHGGDAWESHVDSVGPQKPRRLVAGLAYIQFSKPLETWSAEASLGYVMRCVLAK